MGEQSPEGMNPAELPRTLLVSYRPIHGYESGTYDRALMVVAGHLGPSSDGHHAEAECYVQAQKLMADTRAAALNGLRTVTPGIGEVIVYSGLYAQAEALAFAQELQETTGQAPQLVVCKCELPYKIEFAQKMGVQRMVLAECSGMATMGRIANYILGKTGIDPRTQAVSAAPGQFLERYADYVAQRETAKRN